MSVLASQRVAVSIPSLIRLAWPIVISRSSQSVVGLADALMVAPLGEGGLAAATTGAMNAIAVFILPMGTVFIVSSFASQFFGKGDAAGARRYAMYGLLVALLSEVLVLAALPALPWAVGGFDFAPEVAASMEAYLAIRLASCGAVVGIEALGNYYGGLGNTRLPMLVNLAAMVLNVFGNWLLITGNLGFPALGVAGAAWASLLATVLAFAAFLAVFLWDGRRRGVTFPRLHLGEFGRMLRFGLPSGFNWFFEFAAFMFFVNVVVAGLGTTALAGMMSVIQLNSAAFMPAFAVASAGAIVVGQAIGAGERDQVPHAVRLAFFLAGGWQVLVGAFYLAAPRLAFAPFARGDPTGALLEVGARMLMLSTAWQLFDAAVATLAEALRAAGDTAFTLWARLALSWLVFVPGSWWSVRVLGGQEVAAMIWLVVYLAGLALVLLLRFRRGAWRRFDLAQSPV